jgi:hypothetical protein
MIWNVTKKKKKKEKEKEMSLIRLFSERHKDLAF